MKTALTDQQRSFAVHRIMFDQPLSSDVQAAFHRTSIACVDNGQKPAGIIEFVCGMYLQFREAVSTHFKGDWDRTLHAVFPEHRFGQEGFVPKVMVEHAADEQAQGGIGYQMHPTDELLRLLWLAMRLAGALGKKASQHDVIVALTLDPGWLKELELNGLSPKGELCDFDADVLSVAFYTTTFSQPEWPTQRKFESPAGLVPPYTLTAKTPAGGFQSLRSARIRLNGADVVTLAWPDKATAIVRVELREQNTVEFGVDGPSFGSLELRITGTIAPKLG